MPTTMSRTTMHALDALYASATGGVALPVISSPANGDLVPISSGRGTLLIFQTTGTAATVVIKSALAPPYGANADVTVTLASTDIQAEFVRNDGIGRFDQGPLTPANAGFVLLNYTTPTALKVYAVTIP